MYLDNTNVNNESQTFEKTNEKTRNKIIKLIKLNNNKIKLLIIMNVMVLLKRA